MHKVKHAKVKHALQFVNAETNVVSHKGESQISQITNGASACSTERVPYHSYITFLLLAPALA